MSGNVGASVRARLTNLVSTRRVDLQRLLVEYGNERLLCRLARSPHANNFVLKGATLFVIWTGRPHRATKDIDLLGFGDPSESRLIEVFREIAAIRIPEDGVVFDPSTVVTEPIRKDTGYGGTRVALRGDLAGARLNIQVDIGFGDAISLPTELAEVPCLLRGLPPTTLRTYPREVAVAEKAAAMILLGPTNSRMKDFYDIWYLAGRFAFDGDRLTPAIRGTFTRRGIPQQMVAPLALSQEFARLNGKQAQWAGFLRRAGLADGPSLSVAIQVIAAFLCPVLLAGEEVTGWRWEAGGPWSGV